MATAKKTTTPVKTGRAVKKAPVKRPATPARPVKAAKPTTSAAKKPRVQPAPAPVPEKAAKAKKPKLVRDSFTIPKTEYAVLDELKQRANLLARPIKKSELLRAGIKALAALPDGAFLAALDKVPAIKTGRPSAA